MLDNEIHDGNSYEKLPDIDVRELGKDFGDFYKEIDDWDEFESKLLDDLIDNPGWLLEKEPELAKIALDVLRTSVGLGKPIKDRLIGQVDERITVPLFLRAIEIFSEQKGYKYLWSAEHYKKGGPLTGTFDISLIEANAHYSSGLSRKREQPCLVRLSIDSLIKKYTASGKHEMVIIFEHGVEGLFESIEIASDVEGLDIKVFKGIKEESTEFENVETKYREVLTDEAEVVGPDDIVDGLEATPANCGILTFVDEQRHIVGVAHCSRYIDKETADELISIIENGFRERGGSLNEVKIEGYNFLGENLDTMLDSLKEIAGIAPLIDSELIMGTTVRVDKNEGEVRDIEYGTDGVEVKSDEMTTEYERGEVEIDNYWDEEKERQFTEFYHQNQLEEEKEDEKKLVNPVGNQDAMRITQIDGETLEIEWIKQDFKKTRFSSKGPESEMYKYIKNRFPDLSKAFLAGFSIMTDDDGKPQTIGDRGGGSSIVSRLEEKEN